MARSHASGRSNVEMTALTVDIGVLGSAECRATLSFAAYCT